MAPWSAAIRTHSTATFRPIATTLLSASATASVRDPPPTFPERENALSSPESAWVPVTMATPSFLSFSAVSTENSHSPGLANPTTWVTTIRETPDPFSTSWNVTAVFPDVLATTTRESPSSRARSSANRAQSPVFSGPGASK